LGPGSSRGAVVAPIAALLIGGSAAIAMPAHAADASISAPFAAASATSAAPAAPAGLDGQDGPCRGEREFAARDGTRLRYRDVCPASGVAGPALPLVLIPGWAMPASIWKLQVDHFSQRRRVIAFDPRGQGRSASGPIDHPPHVRAHDIEDLLGAARLDNAVLVGWSLAVQELLVHADLHGQDRVRCYGFVDNSVRDNPPPGRSFRERLRETPRETMRGFVASMFRSRRSTREIDKLTEQALKMSHADRLAILEYPQPRSYWDAITGRLQRPVWYAITPVFARQGEYLRARRPDTTVTVFERAGHALFVDEPARFNAELEGFLRRCDTADPPPR
jgi:microsomal epoxide hydrolase